ncbi:hypothetical protein [Pseudonocardia lacus]|uniref:hypothetical protein n=1 Tax=Pseudonocardia lacus TaxID=2835865 RepID=UPI001BDCE383|nr:hypothetical protein [Pseudonocardia lacus]
MTSTYDDPHLDTLMGVVAALECGDWRTAWIELFRGDPTGGRAELVDLTVCLRCVVRSMRFQCADGDVRMAWEQLDTATRKLRAGGHPLVLGREPPRTWRQGHLVWATIRLVLRERADLDAARQTFEQLPRGRQELVHACVQHLVWVEFDPWTVRVHPEDRTLLRLDEAAYERFRIINRTDICARATRLRQFADVHRGPVSVKSWQRIGGYGPVREGALRVLAEESVSHHPVGMPVRLGRVRARAHAQQWLRDTVR